MSLSSASTQSGCSCSHPLDCDHACHMRFCDPTETACDLDFLPDEGGLTPWGCAACTPGDGAPHLAACVAGSLGGAPVGSPPLQLAP